jgi:DAK2 domain fusion protein YloV
VLPKPLFLELYLMTADSQEFNQTQLPNLIQKTPADGRIFKQLLYAGLTWLRTNQQLVNSLNVFPVPDGDTGTNMVLTMQAAYDEIADSPEQNLGKITQKVAHGALMGARGNSGVILSQLWRGFARGLDEQVTLDGACLAHALEEARETAYKGVVRPVEGTILTVAKDMAAAAEEALKDTDDPVSIFEHVVAEADMSVDRTPELLDVLRDAGVVDAGGKGLFFIIEGMLRYINGQPLDAAVTTIQPLSALDLENTLETVEPGQDYELVIDFIPHEPLNLERFYGDLDQMGTSIQVGQGEGLYRMHIHVASEKRYNPIEYIESLGTWTKMTLENLIAQMEGIAAGSAGSQLTLAPVEPGHVAVVTVSPGPGIAQIFASLGAAAIIEGGQTMNPSTQEILSAFENLPTDKIIILPNNKNIILSAKASAELTVKDVVVVPSRTIPEGFAAMLRLIPDGDFKTITQEMKTAIDEVQSGEITTATRNVEIDGVPVQEGQIIGLLNDKLVVSSPTLKETTLDLLAAANTQDYDLIALYYGKNVSKPEVNKIAGEIRTAYPDLEFEIHDGGQPHYQFIIAIE